MVKTPGCKTESFDVALVLPSESCVAFFFCLLLLMSLRIKGTTLFQFSCCAWGCQTDLLKERKKRFSGWELCVSLWSEGLQNIHTERSIPAEQSNSSSGLDKVYIMICKVLWEGGGILWQENLLPPTRRFSFSSCRLARFRSPLSLSLSHCFIHLSALETSGSALKLFESKYRGGHFLSTDVFFLNFWFAVLFLSMLNALVSAVQQLEASLFQLFITSLTEEFSHISGMQWI